nr:uncharacterized protein CTRU02_00112 [Colletotrichum truncatum]KAF6801363.1 hypothetical protein CTRU02_00112 [Colletotrichum truncatum]
MGNCSFRAKNTPPPHHDLDSSTWTVCSYRSYRLHGILYRLDCIRQDGYAKPGRVRLRCSIWTERGMAGKHLELRAAASESGKLLTSASNGEAR